VVSVSIFATGKQLLLFTMCKKCSIFGKLSFSS